MGRSRIRLALRVVPQGTPDMIGCGWPGAIGREGC